MSDETMEVVFDYLSALRRRDIDAVASLLDPEAVHQGFSEELICDGRDMVLANVRNGMRREHLGIEHLELVDGGDHVVVGLGGPAFRNRPGIGDREQLFMVFTIREGLIARMDDHLTRDGALRAAGVAPSGWT